MSEEVQTHERIKAELRRQIDGGTLPEGAPVPSEHEISKQYGVGRGTARRALRALEVEGYVERAQGKRTCVAPAARRGRTLPFFGPQTVAVVLPEYLSSFSRRVLEGFMGYTALHGYQCVVYHQRLDPEGEREFLRASARSGVEGLALWLQHVNDEARSLLEDLAARPFPVVLIDRSVRGLPMDFVGSDNEALCYRLTRALIDRGHQRIGFLTGPVPFTSTEDRFRGYRQALKEAGIPFRETGVGRIHPSDGSAPQVIHELMARRDEPTAFCAVNDFIARQAAQELIRLDYRIPQDVELAAVDDEHFLMDMGVTMIGLEQPAREIGRQSAEVLLARIETPDRPPDVRRLPPLTDIELGVGMERVPCGG